MAQINLVTGYTGEAHIKSEDDALLNRFLLGIDNAVLRVSETHTTSAFNVAYCDAIINGRLVRVDEPITFSMTPPSSGYARCDAIYIVYSKDNNGVETAYLDYVKGTGSFPYTPPSAPSHGGVTESSFRIYYIQWSGTQTISEVSTPPSAPLKVPTINYNAAKYSAELTGINDGAITPVDLGHPEVYKIPLVGGCSLTIGTLTPNSYAVQKDSVYAVKVTPTNSSFGGTVFASGVNVNGGSSLGATTTFSKISASQLNFKFKAVTDTTNTTDNMQNYQFVFWFITINDFS